MPDIATGTVLSAEFPASDVSGMRGRLSGATIIEEVGHHDRITLYYAGSPKYVGETLLSGAPFKLRMRDGSGTRDYHGYVESIRKNPGTSRYGLDSGLDPITTGMGSTPTTDSSAVVGLGITYPMKKTSKDVHHGPVGETAADLILRSSLTPVIGGPGIPVVTPQNGDSDWSLLNRMLRDYGLMVCIIDGSVLCLPPEDMVREFGTEAATLIRHGHRDRARWGYIQRYLEDLSTNNDGTDRWSTEHMYAGVDQVTSATSQSSSGSGMFSALNQGGVVTDELTAEARAYGAERYALPQEMKTEGIGWNLVRAGGPVYVQDSGWWLVRRVEHTVANGAYTMRTVLRTSDRIKGLPAPPPEPVVNVFRRRPGTRVRLSRSPSVPIVGTSSWKENLRWVT